MMRTFICLQCAEGRACTLIKPDDRINDPIYCTPDGLGKLRQPIWMEVPEKRQS
jgi:hypothetical protein